MARLNMTLDKGTDERLSRYAHRTGARKATLAREILQDGLRRREQIEERRLLAKDYIAGRADAERILKDFEAGSLEILGEEDD